MRKINHLSPQEHPYSLLLTGVDKSIETLFSLGELPHNRIPSVAIVGTRKPTNYGKEMAYKLAYELASRGIVIISGLALGTDSIAHRGALDAKGKTIAVLANGLDTVYPSSHRKLAEKIIDNGGALLSEYKPGTPAFKQNFIARNRIVSGLSDVLIVIEAAQRSGTLSTAGFALEQGKLVYALPGNVTSPQSAGCNMLLKQGAMPVTETKDILDGLGIDESLTQPRLIFGDNAEEDSIIELLKAGERDGDSLLRKSGLSAARFSQTLTMLEIKGTVRALGGNNWSLRG